MTHALSRPRALALLALLGGLGTGASEATEVPASGSPQHWLRGRIGVQVQALTPELRAFFSAPQDRGVLVARIEPDRPAARADLRVGDVLVEADGTALRQPHDLLRAVGAVAEGGSLELKLVRDGSTQTLRVAPDGALRPPVLRPDAWQGFERWFEQGVRHGSQAMRRQLEDLERRLQELERRLDGGGARDPAT